MLTLKNIYESVLDLPEISDKDIIKRIRDEIKQFLSDNYFKVKYKISNKPNHNGKFVVDYDGPVGVRNLCIKNLTNGLFEFGTIVGYFDCSKCLELVSLEGAPKKVLGDFTCKQCWVLTSLEGAPEEVGGDFNCDWCAGLKTLKGAPKKVGREFFCSYCKSLTSLEGAPKKLNGSFQVRHSPLLKSLRGAPEKVFSFICNGCSSLKSLKDAPKEVNGTFSCFDCAERFTDHDVRSVSDVKGAIIN